MKAILLPFLSNSCISLKGEVLKPRDHGDSNRGSGPCVSLEGEMLEAETYSDISKKLRLRILHTEVSGFEAYALIAASDYLYRIYGVFILPILEEGHDPLALAVVLLSKLIPGARAHMFIGRKRIQVHSLTLSVGNLESLGFTARVPVLNEEHMIPAAMALLSYLIVNDIRRTLEEEYRTIRELVQGKPEELEKHMEKPLSLMTSYPVILSLLSGRIFLNAHMQQVYDVIADGLELTSLVSYVENLLSNFTSTVHSSLSLRASMDSRKLLNGILNIYRESEKTSRRLAIVQDLLAALSILSLLEILAESWTFHEQGFLQFLDPLHYYVVISLLSAALLLIIILVLNRFRKVGPRNAR